MNVMRDDLAFIVGADDLHYPQFLVYNNSIVRVRRFLGDYRRDVNGSPIVVRRAWDCDSSLAPNDGLIVCDDNLRPIRGPEVIVGQVDGIKEAA